MPRKALQPGQPVPPAHRTAAGEALSRAWTPGAYAWWLTAARAYATYAPTALVHGEFDLAALSGRAAVLNALGSCAALLFKHPLVQHRWASELEVRKALEDLLGEAFSGVQQRFHEPRLKAPRGPLPGPKPQRVKFTDEWIGERDAAVRSEWRRTRSDEPTDLDVAEAIPLKYITYRRWKDRQSPAGEK
jgi:hypothetical protein